LKIKKFLLYLVVLSGYCQLVDRVSVWSDAEMFQSSDFPRLEGFRFPRSIIAYAVWAYHRFALSTADVEDLLAERGIAVSRETIRKRVNRFGSHFARCIRRDRPKPNSKWHLDEAVIVIGGVKYWLWRAIYGDGDVLDILLFSPAGMPRWPSVSSARWSHNSASSGSW
jgi:hypothetical protein